MGKAFSAAIKLTILDHYNTRFSSHEGLKRGALSSRVRQLFLTTTTTAINSSTNIEIADHRRHRVTMSLVMNTPSPPRVKHSHGPSRYEKEVQSQGEPQEEKGAVKSIGEWRLGRTVGKGASGEAPHPVPHGIKLLTSYYYLSLSSPRSVNKSSHTHIAMLSSCVEPIRSSQDRKVHAHWRIRRRQNRPASYHGRIRPTL